MYPVDHSRGYQGYGEQGIVVSFLFAYFSSVASGLTSILCRLKNYTGTLRNLLFSLLFLASLRANCLFYLSQSGGNMQLLVIKTLHSPERANIMNPMMF